MDSGVRGSAGEALTTYLLHTPNYTLQYSVPVHT
jgi:hypothetical protein